MDSDIRCNRCTQGFLTEVARDKHERGFSCYVYEALYVALCENRIVWNEVELEFERLKDVWMKEYNSDLRSYWNISINGKFLLRHRYQNYLNRN